MNEYVELHCHSFFSLKDGASSPEALIDTAAALGMDRLALTDHDALYGAPRFADAAAIAGIQPVFGAELTVDGTHLILLVENAAGWSNLCWLISQAQANAPKGFGCLFETQLEGRTKGLIALSGCRQGAVAQALLRRDEPGAFAAIQHYQKLFGRDHYFIELQNHHLRDDPDLIDALAGLAARAGLETVATNNVHYATRSRHALQDVMVCIGKKLPLDENPYLRPNSEYYLKSGAEMQRLFAHYPAAVSATRPLAERCQYALDNGLQKLPIFPTPDGIPTGQYLHQLCLQGCHGRFGGVPARVQQQLDYELQVIDKAGLANYFLIIWDIMRWAKAQGIYCQGRGSAANSLVAYVLGISPVDPLAHDLVFERFLSEERQTTPDIDIDFDNARREEVIQYIYGRYGRDHAAMACTFLCFRAKSAVRDVGKALGLSHELVTRATRLIRGYGAGTLKDAEALQEVLGDTASAPVLQHLLALSEALEDVPRDLGIHSGGMVITGTPLLEMIPIEPARMEERSVVQWDKDGLERTGKLKVDALGLGILAALAEMVGLVDATTE